MPPDATGVRPQIRYTYQQVAARFKNGSGVLVNGSPVWKLTSTSMCRTLASCAGTSDEIVKSFNYDDNLHVASETTRSGDGSISATITKEYDAVGNLIWVDGPLAGSGDRTRFVYNASRELTATMSPDPDGGGPLPVPVKRTTYDPDGKPTRVEYGTVVDQTDTALAGMTVLRWVDTTYDAAGAKITEYRRAPGLTYGVTQYSYDADGNLECTAERMNSATFASLPQSACSLSTEGAFGPDRITKRIYDAYGRLVAVQKAYGTSRQINERTVDYNDDNQIASLVDANGNKSTYTYDDFYRRYRMMMPSVTTVGQSSSVDYEEYGYDANNNRTSFRKRDGRVFSYQYDALNRLTVKFVPDACVAGYVCTNVPAAATRDVYYSYDLRGLQLAARFDGTNGADAVTDSYDALGRLRSTTTSMGGVSRTVGSLYDAAGNRTQITFPDGNFFVYAYDTLDRPLSISENGGALVATMRWDAQGRRSGEGRGGVSSIYGYDLTSRLNSLTDDLAGSGNDITTTIEYSPANQISTLTRSNTAYSFSAYGSANRSYGANGLNQYTTVGANSYTYDSNGNLTSDGGKSYIYDADNRLVSSSSGAELTYDPLGKLYQTYSPATGYTRFLYDGDQLIAEYSNLGSLLRRYVHGTGEDDPLLWYEGAGLGDRRSLQTDYLGSIVSIADGAGNALQTYNYDEYGVPGGVYAGRFQYTGQAWLPELGMYYYKARVYSPMLGRFLQTDPIGYDDQTNLYAYVQNDPVNLVDPDGTEGGCGDGKTSCRTDEQIKRDLRNARAEAVRRAWAQERELVKKGGGTRAWTPAQKAELLRTGQVKGFEGHHRNTVNGNSLESARNPDNIEFLTRLEHRELHLREGGYRTPIRGRPLLSRGFNALSILPDITGMLSGRIRTDTMDNFFSDMAGVDSKEDRLNEIAQRCGRAAAAAGQICT